MVGRCVTALGLAMGLAPAGWAQTPRPDQAFKYAVKYYEIAAEPIGVGEIVAWRGRIYQFSSELKEFVVIDFASGKVEMIDVSRRIQASVSIAKVNELLAARKRRTLKTAENLEQKPDRSSRMDARTTRNLVEPHFKVSFNAAAGQLRLTNESVEIDAAGVPEPDAERLALIADALEILTKLAAVRDAKSIPPYTRLELITLLVRQKKLRPTEMTFLFRVNGPPDKKRWTYRFEPKLQDRDFIGLARLDRYRETCKRVAIADYEKAREDEE